MLTILDLEEINNPAPDQSVIEQEQKTSQLQTEDLLRLASQPACRIRRRNRIEALEQTQADEAFQRIMARNGMSTGLLTIAHDERTLKKALPRLRKPRKPVRVAKTPRKPETARKPSWSLPTDPEIARAVKINGWNPDAPEKLKGTCYIDNKELFHVTCMVVDAGSINAANGKVTINRPGCQSFSGTWGERFYYLMDLLARNYMGRIAFSDSGSMSNLADDLIQEALTKCCLVAHRFKPWKLSPEDALEKTRKAKEKWEKYGVKKKARLAAEGKTPKVWQPAVNNAFAYFTTVTRNRMYETLDCPLQQRAGNTGISIGYLEDMKSENQSIGDLW